MKGPEHFYYKEWVQEMQGETNFLEYLMPYPHVIGVRYQVYCTSYLKEIDFEVNWVA